MPFRPKLYKKDSMSTLSVRLNDSPKVKPGAQNLGFGQHFSDHMLVANYNGKTGWGPAEIRPYGPLEIDPAASVLHYGQALFEGMKAFRQKDGRCVLFRPEYNWERMRKGAERLCMQAPPQELFLHGIARLVDLEKEWIPSTPGASLYIRPTLIGTEGFLGVRPSENYMFFVILSPVGSYYGEGVKPLKIWVEDLYIRASPGGLGATKAAANYAASLKAAQESKKAGFSQVLWLDVNREYIEEVGTMNVFFVLENEIVTPALDGTILSGGTRDSVLQLLKSWNLPVSERKIKVSEIREASAQGKLKEVFGTGTAAVISPVGELSSRQWKIQLDGEKSGPLAQRLYNELTSIQYGTQPDAFKWLRPLSDF